MWILSYWLLPTISALVWVAMLITMLTYWSLSGSPVYPSMERNQRIAYISDVGAFTLKPLFIAASAVTVVSLDLGFLAERWLRHTGRLAPNTSLTQRVLDWISLVFALIGAAGLILLSIFDTYRYRTLHNLFLLFFIGGYIISAIFLCAEYQRLGIHYRHHRILAISFWIKLFFILVELALAVVFIALSFTGYRNAAAILEWTVSFVFTFYVLSFIVDLSPSVRTKSHVPQGQKVALAERGLQGRLPGSSGSNSGEMSYEQNLTTDSAGPNQRGEEVYYEPQQQQQRYQQQYRY